MAAPNTSIYDRNVKHIEFHIPTQDDWSPNFIRNTVRVRVWEAFHIRTNRPHRWARLCIWGDGDVGMEKDFALSIHQQVREHQLRMIMNEAKHFPNPLNQDWLLLHGFIRA